MSRISMQALRIVVAIVIIGAGNGCSRGGLVIDGKHVKEVKTRWALIWGLPLPGPVWQDYYEYTDASGKQVQHGPYRSFRRDGTLDYSAFYREGKLDGTLTRFDENGDKSEMNFYDMGELVGVANYDHGHLIYEYEELLSDHKVVAEKHFEKGRWSLSFVCGNAVDRSIDEKTGVVTALKPPFSIACQH